MHQRGGFEYQTAMLRVPSPGVDVGDLYRLGEAQHEIPDIGANL
jgi:hypothetical protein